MPRIALAFDNHITTQFNLDALKIAHSLKLTDLWNQNNIKTIYIYIFYQSKSNARQTWAWNLKHKPVVGLL